MLVDRNYSAVEIYCIYKIGGSMEFAKFMATPFGRALRIVPGVLLAYWGFFASGGWAWGVVGLVLIASGALNVCALSKLFGGPFQGNDT